MKPQKSLYDDEKLWFGYARAIAANQKVDDTEVASNWADAMLKEHRKRFPK